MLPVNDLVIRVDYKIDKPCQNVSVSMGSWTEGEPACDPVLVGNLAGLPVTYFYKVRGTEDSTYTTVKPGLEGYYTVKAVVAESETYSEEAVTANFSIKVIRTSVVTEEGTPNSVVDNLDEDLAISLLSEEEQTLYDGGESLRVYLEVKAESETTEISAEDKIAARAAVEESGASEGMYLDLSLFKKIGENEPTAVHESENAFDITVDVPEELATPDFGYIRTYSVIRVHNGVATELPTTYANGKISFSTDRFSTYLIAYSDNFDEDGDYIEFTTTVTGELVRYVDDHNIGDTVTVTYKITHNDGFNSLLLIPQYDTEVFSIQSISASEVALGAATVTQGDGTKKILLENTGAKYNALDGEEEFFLTVVYKIIAPVGGEYEFGLDLTSEGENNKSVAYYIENGESKGEQTRVAIKVVMVNALTLVVKQEATIEIGSNNVDQTTDENGIVRDYFFGYTKQEVGVHKVDELTDIANADGYYVEFTYDVYYPAATQAGDHSGTSVSISGKALAALGTAFQMENPSSGISSAIRTYSAGAPAEGTCKFYACYPTGSNSIVSSGSTANGYGHWFDANGGVTSYGNGYVFSEFAPSTLTFTLGQYPQRLRNGQEYTIVQAIRYKKDNKIAKATFKFNIHITQDKTGAELSEIEEHTVPVGINDIHAVSPSQTAIYNLSGNRVKANADSSCATDGLAPGIYIINHKKVLVK